MKDRHQTADSIRDHARRTARRLAGDGSIKSICGKTRPVPGLVPAMEVCKARPNHDGPCFEWDAA